MHKVIYKYKEISFISKIDRVDQIYKIGIYKLLYFVYLLLKVVAIIDFCGFYILTIIIYIFCKVRYTNLYKCDFNKKRLR